MTLNIIDDFIPPNMFNRTERRNKVTHITIHHTGNTSKGANAVMHARYVKGLSARLRRVSWHFTVDDNVTMKHMPITEVAFHAGSAEGNNCSVGIEICMHQGQDFNKAYERAACLVGLLMKAHDIPIERVVMHRHWTGKHCPSLLIDEAKGWSFPYFRARCAFWKDKH